MLVTKLSIACNSGCSKQHTMTSPNKSHGRKAIRPTLKPRELMTPTPDLAGVWKAKIITLFPGAFPGVLGESLTGKALQEGLWQLETVDLREFGAGKHRNVDDTPAGGGAGMVLRADVLGNAIEHTMAGTKGNWPLIYLSPRGRRMDQQMMQNFAAIANPDRRCIRPQAQQNKCSAAPAPRVFRKPLANLFAIDLGSDP